MRARGGKEGGGAEYRGEGGAPGKEEATGASEVDGGAPAIFGFSLFFLFFSFSFSPSFVCFSPLLLFYLCVFFSSCGGARDST